MQAITIFDTLYFRANTTGQIALTSGWSGGLCAGDGRKSAARRQSSVGELPAEEENLVYRAVKLLQQHSGTRLGASMRLVKRIPSSAGLGGASSDAAAALMVANQGWNLGWSRERLAELAGRLGSDVPFFFGGPTAVCRGRGTRVEPVDNRARLHLVVLRPSEGVSTAAVYGCCEVPRRPVSIAPMVEAVRRGAAADLGACMFNRLQRAAERLSPWIGRARDRFDELDVLGHQMSGSGTSYFAICRHARHARRVAETLRGKRLGCVMYASTLGAVSRRHSLFSQL